MKNKTIQFYINNSAWPRGDLNDKHSLVFQPKQSSHIQTSASVEISYNQSQ